MKLKRALVAALLAISLSSASCLGPDHAYGQVKNWNVGLSEQDWVNEVVFLALWIIPVYPIAQFADIVAFNTIQYWSGDNPINDPGAFKGFSSKD
jgi:hypothetical protein